MRSEPVWWSRMLWGLFSLAVVLAAGIAGALLGYNQHAPKPVTVQELVSPAFDGMSRLRILALGMDQVSGNTDTIIVATVDFQNRAVYALSIPRDTRADIPGHHTFKVNAAYAWGGLETARQTVENLLGTRIDRVVLVRLEGLKRIVDLLGGVEIDIEKDMHYVDRKQRLYIHLKKGYRLLDGEKALHYVRFRHDPQGDLGRIGRQHKFLKALARRMFQWQEVDKLPELTRQVMQQLETDLSTREVLHLARFGKDLPPERIVMGVLPGQPANIDGISYYLPDEARVASALDELERNALAQTTEEGGNQTP
ncbi:MAG: LCP family protein [Armatimonadota bacterium]|nr:LCP family protein [bacterium]MDW8105269.1 LCP family protein [Armatimonadota bacterium]MDW8291147.1 LCP family protein [Armatimonadota bacterium]